MASASRSSRFPGALEPFAPVQAPRPQSITDRGQSGRKCDKSSKPASKKDVVIALLRRERGASVSEVAEATRWRPHSVTALLDGTVKTKRDLQLVSEKAEDQERRYHVAAIRSAAY